MKPAPNNFCSPFTPNPKGRLARGFPLGSGCGRVFLIFFLFLFISCKKKETALQQDSFVKSYASESDLSVVNTFQLDDGNYLIASANYYNHGPGEALKIDANGNKIWQKPLSALVLLAWKVIPVPGTGFLIFGIREANDNAMYLCLYDNDGNLVATDSVITGLPNNYKTPYNIIRLSNGNYVMAGGSANHFNYKYVYVRILSPALKTLTYHQYLVTGNTDNLCRALCELPDGSVAIFATVAPGNSSIKNLFFLKTDLNGALISSRLFRDTVYSESANVVVPHNAGMLVATGKMRGLSIGYDLGIDSINGISIDYYNSYQFYGSVISGRINIRQYDNTGLPTDSTEITEYPKNGMLNSIRQTNDGGYILCGTVNQLSTILIVSDTRIYLLRLDANLDVQWSKMISSTYPAIGNDAIQTPDGGYLVTGLHKTFNQRCEALIIKTDANGNF